MSIDPTKSPSTSPVSGVRVDQATTKQSGQVKPVIAEQARETAGREDQVKISDEARVAGQHEGKDSTSGIPSERFQTILKRLNSGFYDNPEVRDRIAQRLQRELGDTMRAD